MDITNVEIMSRAEAERRLNDPKKPVHSYIVRFSKGSSVLSVKFDDGIKHYVIKHTHGFYHIYDFKFRTISELLESYSDDWTQLLRPPLIRKKGMDNSMSPMRQEKSGYSCHCKNVTAKEAEDYLADKSNFDFVIRPCGVFIDCKMLTIKTPSGFRNYRLNWSAASCHIFKNKRFPNCDALIATYSENNWDKLLNRQPTMQWFRFDGFGAMVRSLFSSNKRRK